MYDAHSGEKMHVVSGNERTLSACLVTTPDDRLAMFERKTEARSAIELFDMVKRRRVRKFELPGQRIVQLKATPDLRRVVIAFQDGRISVWDFDHTWGPDHIDLPALQERVSQALVRISKGEHDPAGLAALGQWYAFREVDHWAVDLLEEARASGQEISSLTLGRCYWRLGRRAEAAREFRAALDRSGDAPPSRLQYLQMCLTAIEHPPQ